MKEIADQTNKERPEKDHISPHKVGWIIGDRLKLEKIKSRVYTLKWDGEKIQKLCERYGIVIDEGDFVRLFDFSDLLREPPGKVETEDCDFSRPSHKKSPKSQSRKLSPEDCKSCDHIIVSPGCLRCDYADQRPIRELEECPLPF